jgi:hypothetical protein
MGKFVKSIYWLLVVLFAIFLTSEKWYIFPVHKKVSASQDISIPSAAFGFDNKQAIVTFLAKNNLKENLSVSGEVSMTDGLGRKIWVKDFRVDNMILGKATRVDLSWPASIRLIGRPRMEVTLKDAQDRLILAQDFHFIVLPGVVGGLVLVSLAFASTKGMGKFLGFV